MAELRIATETANPHSRAKLVLTEGVGLVDTQNRAGGACDAPAHGIGTEVQMHDDPTSPSERSVYYFNAYVRVEASSVEEAWERIQGEEIYLNTADAAQGPDDAVQLVVTDLADEPERVAEPPECICPPELVERGGFKGGCPVHG